MPRFEETVAARERRVKLYKESGHPDRTKTLDRFFEAVEAIASGEAYIMARDHEMLHPLIDPKRFRVRGKVPPAMIDAYTRMRELIEGQGSRWTGPRGEYIRGDEDLRTYLKERFGVPREEKGQRVDRNIEAIIDSIRDPADQSAVRAHIEALLLAKAAGKQAKVKADIAAQMFRNLEAKDFDETVGKKGFDPKSPVERGLAGNDRLTLQSLVRRLFDNDFLAEFELKFDKGRVQQDAKPFSHFIFFEEISLLARLCGISIPP